MKQIDPNRLCPHCLNSLPQKGGKCPRCGYDPQTAEQSPRCIPPYTVLAGRYFVGTVLGEGGFGITYRGLDLLEARKIAIKEYFPATMATRDTSRGGNNTVQSISGQMRVYFQAGLEKYENEARCLMALKGTAGIVDILDFFKANATAYIVMEFVEGATLRDTLVAQGGCLAEQQVLAIFQPLLTSLEKVHSAGIVHRDISPDNILVQPDGSLKLIDFGAARLSTGEVSQSLTVILKHGYAPEEQYRNHSRQGPFTDVYAIGATMYKALTGVTPADAMSRMFDDTVRPLHTFPNRISPQTSAALQKGMAVRAEARYQTAGALAAALYDKQVTYEPTLAMPVAKRKRSGRMLLLIALGVILSGSALFALLSLSNPAQSQIPASQSEAEEPAPPQIPELEGMTEETARAEMEALGLLVSVDYADADGAHTGKVLSWVQTSAQSVQLTVGKLTNFQFETLDDGIEITGVETDQEFLELPSTINGVQVVSVGAYAFAAEEGDEENALRKVSFPDGLKRIGEGAFSNCIFLMAVELPDTMEQIGDGAFWNCSAIETLELGSVQEIGAFAFQYCFCLPEILLPDGCRTVGEEAFSGCMGAVEIYVPASVVEIGPGAFTGCLQATASFEAGTYAETYFSESDLPVSIQPPQ